MEQDKTEPEKLSRQSSPKSPDLLSSRLFKDPPVKKLSQSSSSDSESERPLARLKTLRKNDFSQVVLFKKKVSGVGGTLYHRSRAAHNWGKLKAVVAFNAGIRQKTTGIREGFDVKTMWKKARGVLRTISQLRRLREEIEMFGTRNKTMSPVTLEKFMEKQASLCEDKKEVDTPWYIILPNSALKFAWSIVLAIIFLYTALLMPVHVAFVDSSDYAWSTVETVVDALFWTDIGFNLISAYYDDNEVLITDLKSIILNYLKTWFLIDFVACFPFDSFTVSGSGFLGQYNNLLRLLRLYRLGRLLKISKLFTYGKASAHGVFDYSDALVYHSSTIL